MNKDIFVQELNNLNISISEFQLEQLDKFYNLLISWNEKINLTAITAKNDVYLKHFFDSLTLIKAIDLKQELTVLDVGTGAGFPGIVLKIVFPNLKITLLDALKKRVDYLKIIIKELDLKDIDVIWSRAEEYTKINREKYDLVVARAVSDLKVLVELTFASVKINGYFIAMKGQAQEEIKNAQSIISTLSGTIEDIITFELPIENSKRTLIKIKKIKNTPLKYPRKFAEIKKNNRSDKIKKEKIN